LAKQNLQFEHQIVIVGDNPKRDDVLHIDSPRISHGEYKRRYGQRLKSQRCCDSIVKLQRAIDSQAVTDEFVRLYDDMFILKPVALDELKIQRHRGRVEPSEHKQSGWREHRRKTFHTLRSAGLTTYDFSTHGPVVFCKNKLQETIGKFDLLHQPALVETVYQNHWLDPSATLVKSSWFRFATCENDWDIARPPAILTIQNKHVADQLDKIREKFLQETPAPEDPNSGLIKLRRLPNPKAER
jgi:hypothetical protein